MLDFLWIVGTGHIHKVGGIFGNRFIVAQFLDLWNVMFQPHKFHVAVLDLSRCCTRYT